MFWVVCFFKKTSYNLILTHASGYVHETSKRQFTLDELNKVYVLCQDIFMEASHEIPWIFFILVYRKGLFFYNYFVDPQI